MPNWGDKIVVYLDDFSCFKQMYLSKKKSNTGEILKAFDAEVESKWNLSLSIKSDTKTNRGWTPDQVYFGQD